jgi:hypothetical protein
MRSCRHRQRMRSRRSESILRPHRPGAARAPWNRVVGAAVLRAVMASASISTKCHRSPNAPMGQGSRRSWRARSRTRGQTSGSPVGERVAALRQWGGWRWRHAAYESDHRDSKDRPPPRSFDPPHHAHAPCRRRAVTPGSIFLPDVFMAAVTLESPPAPAQSSGESVPRPRWQGAPQPFPPCAIESALAYSASLRRSRSSTSAIGRPENSGAGKRFSQRTPGG